VWTLAVALIAAGALIMPLLAVLPDAASREEPAGKARPGPPQPARPSRAAMARPAT